MIKASVDQPPDYALLMLLLAAAAAAGLLPAVCGCYSLPQVCP
jgi:hypothetical protein